MGFVENFKLYKGLRWTNPGKSTKIFLLGFKGVEILEKSIPWTHNVLHLIEYFYKDEDHILKILSPYDKSLRTLNRIKFLSLCTEIMEISKFHL